MPSMLINGNGVKAKKLMELENALVESQKRLTALETTNEVLRKKMEDQDCKMTELGDNLSGIGEAITELQHKHPDITMADLTAIKQPLENAIKDINGKMDLVISFLEKNQGFKPTKQ
jgi:predicted  nucleic acid-binding Zn-ribbon protein